MFSRKLLVSFVATFLVATPATFSLASRSAGHSLQLMVTDRATGRSVLLESRGGKTVVTDVETGDSIVVDGMLAEQMSDDEYTEMMSIKRQLAETTLEPEVKTFEGKALSATGNFNVSGGTGGLTTKKYPLVKGTASVKIYAVCSRPGGDYVRVTLYRYNSFWFDTSYGTNSYPADKSGKTTTKSWSVDKDAYYYLKIDKDYNGYWASGQFTLTN